MIPLFSSHYSPFKSILTLEEPVDIDDTKPISIFSIAKKYNLKEVFLADTKFAGFPQAYKNSKKCNIDLRFGFIVNVCRDLEDKSEENLKTEHKVIIWMLNSAGYEDLIKIYSKASIDGFYYKPRIDLPTLNQMWSKNLLLSIAPYDNFINNNCLKNNNCIVEWQSIEPILMYAEDMDLTFDSLLSKAIKEYASSYNFQILRVHPIYYFNYNCFKAYAAYRCIGNGTKYEKPNLDYFCSHEFCFESYLNKNK